MALTLFAGYLKDAEVSVAALSICTNILGWTSTISFGLNVAISVRVSNELGASHPRKAKFLGQVLDLQIVESQIVDEGKSRISGLKKMKIDFVIAKVRRIK